MKFYVYQYITEFGTPYYIGKGSGRRIHVEHKHTESQARRDAYLKSKGVSN